MDRLRSYWSRLSGSETMPLGRQLGIILGMLLVSFLLRLPLDPLARVNEEGGLAAGTTSVARVLALLPTLLAAWLFGMWGGLITSLLSALFNTVFLNLTGELTGWDALLQNSTYLVGSVMLIVIGAVVGRMRDLEVRARSELRQRVQVEAALRQSQARLETVVTNTPIVLFALDSQGLFTLLEGKGLARLGLQSEQMIGRSALAIYANNPLILSQIQRALAGEQTLWITEANDLTFEILTNPVQDQTGRVTGVIGVAFDITERKLAEAAMAKARDAALESSDFKSRLLANVSHELHTPLGAVIGYAEMLQDGIYGPISPEQSDKLDEIIGSSQHLTSLVRELLDQARLESGRLKLDNTPFSPAGIMEAVRNQMIVLAQRKRLVLTGEVAEGVPASLHGDAKRIQQILTNLVGNAIKFTDEGIVQIKIYRPETTSWALEVSDTGSGIPPEKQTTIFEPFHQLNGTAGQNSPGFGLGLSIVHQLVGLMGGRVNLASEPGRGSTFTVILPLEPAYKEPV